MNHRGIKITQRPNGSYQAHYHRDGVRKRPVRKSLAELKSWIDAELRARDKLGETASLSLTASAPRPPGK